jgi:hypothetical protein
MKNFLNGQLADIKQYGYANHIISFLFILFFIYVSKKLQLELSMFAFVYWYVACSLMGHFAVHNVSRYKGKKWKYKKVKNDTYVAIPVAGAINMITYGIPILVIDYFFKIISI